jgi:PAS domain S-box-containing protein
MKKKIVGSRKRTRRGDLRARAEQLLREAPGKIRSMPAEDFGFLVHELRVHQAELEIQNEELRDAQNELEESRNRYFELYDLAPMGYFTLGKNGIILEANIMGATLLGTEKARLKRKLFARFVLDDDQKIFFSHVGRLIESNKAQTCELRLMSTDDKPVYVRMESTPVKNGVEDVVSIRSAVVDVTGQKKALLALRQSEERFRLIAETSPDIIFEMDVRGCIAYCSPSVERILGYTPAETEGVLFLRYTSPSDRPAVRENFQRLILGEGIKSFDLRILGKGGTPVPFEINACSLLSAGEVEFILGIARDITERAAMEDDLREARDELQIRVQQRTAELAAANDELRAEVEKRKRFEEELRSSGRKILAESERRRFLSRRLVETIERDRRDVAMYLHDEIGQMLATAKMDIEMLEDDASRSGAPRKEKLEQIREKILTVMGNVRDVSRKLRPDMLDTLGLVPSLRSLIRTFQEDEGLSIEFFHGEIPEGFDAGKALAVYRIVQEALNNVAKHAKATEVFVNVVMRSDSLFLNVEDNGKGFDYKKMTETAAAEGSLGVMIMKERAVQAGGELSVESKIGKGTQVMLELPIG